MEYFKVDVLIVGFYDSIFVLYDMLVNEEQFDVLIQMEGFDYVDSISLFFVCIMVVELGDEIVFYYSCDWYNGLYEIFYFIVDFVYQ